MQHRACWRSLGWVLRCWRVRWKGSCRGIALPPQGKFLKFGILGSQTLCLTPSLASALDLQLPLLPPRPRAPRMLQPHRFEVLSQHGRGGRDKKNPFFFPPRLRMPEWIGSPCTTAEPALLTVGPSFPCLAGGFPEDVGYRLHPGEAGDAPLKPPSPVVTSSPLPEDKF